VVGRPRAKDDAHLEASTVRYQTDTVRDTSGTPGVSAQTPPKPPEAAVREAGKDPIPPAPHQPAPLPHPAPRRPGPAPPGPTRPGPARPGPARPDSRPHPAPRRPGPAPPGPTRPGPARPGPAPPGPTRPGPARPGPARPGPARPDSRPHPAPRRPGPPHPGSRPRPARRRPAPRRPGPARPGPAPCVGPAGHRPLDQASRGRRTSQETTPPGAGRPADPRPPGLPAVRARGPGLVSRDREGFWWLQRPKSST
jgi:hypothetical protein